MRTLLLLAAVLVVALSLWLARVPSYETGATTPEGSLASSIAAETPVELERADDAATRARAEVPEREVELATFSSRPVRAAPVARATLAVRVTSSETGEPLAGVPIEFDLPGDQFLMRTKGATTGEDGIADVDVPAGRAIAVHAKARAGEREGGSAQVDDPLAADERREVALAVKTGDDFVAYGIVLASDTRAPIGGVLVEAAPSVIMRDAPSTRTAGDGTFELPLRSYATDHLEYSHALHGSTRSDFRAHGTPSTAVVVLLEPSAAIDARIVDRAGRPTDWWEVVALDLRERNAASKSTDEPGLVRVGEETSAGVHDGLAEVRGLKAGVPLGLELRRGKTVVWRTRDPIVLANGERRALTIELGGASLHGFVRDEAGDAVPKLTLAVHPAGSLDAELDGSERARATATSGDDGAYRFDGLEPGAWWIGPSVLGSSGLFGRGRGMGAQIESVVIPSGELAHDIVIATPRTISGRVVGANEARESAALWNTIEVFARRETDPSRASARASEDGAFSLTVYGDRDWILEARGPTGSSDPVRARAGATDVVLRLPPRADCEIVGVDERGAQLAIDAPRLFAASSGVPVACSPVQVDGVWTIRGLRAGAFGFAVTSGARYTIERDVAVAGIAGRTQRIEIVLRDGGRARVRFDGPGDSASLEVRDRGIVLESATLVRGSTREVPGPLGELELRLVTGGATHERRVRFEREPAETVVFDGGWR